MMTPRQVVSIAIAATLLLSGLSMDARAFGPGGGGLPPFGGELRGITQITGSVVCVGCRLHEVRAAHPELSRLYQMNHPTGQLVITVKSVNEAARWESIVGLSRQITARASSRLMQQLTAEENLFKEVLILGLLRSNRTLDIGEIKIVDPNPELLSSDAATRVGD